MQNAKDTFYMMLRDRIAVLNPARTVLVRGQLRPAVVVEENELVSSFAHRDTFVLRWTEMVFDTQLLRTLMRQRCEIRYATAGNTGNGGMDRGRALSTMDMELAHALNIAPQNIEKQSYAAGAPVAMGSNIFWTDVRLDAGKADGELLERVAYVDIFSVLEEGGQ